MKDSESQIILDIKIKEPDFQANIGNGNERLREPSLYCKWTWKTQRAKLILNINMKDLESQAYIEKEHERHNSESQAYIEKEHERLGETSLYWKGTWKTRTAKLILVMIAVDSQNPAWIGNENKRVSEPSLPIELTMQRTDYESDIWYKKMYITTRDAMLNKYDSAWYIYIFFRIIHLSKMKTYCFSYPCIFSLWLINFS